jgi:KDO2-lipid IV(A) lauroyltransferase
MKKKIQRYFKIFILYPLEFIFLILFILMVRITPFRMIHPTMGFFLSAIGPYLVRKQTVLDNMISVGFSKEKSKKTLAGLWRHLGYMIVEIIHTKYVMKHATFDLQQKDLIKLPDDIQHPSALLFSTHQGNWELIANIAADLFGEDLRIYFRGANNTLVNKVLLWYRRKQPGKIIMKSKDSRQQLKTQLGQRTGNVLLLDQRTKQGIDTKFMGKPVKVFYSPLSFAYDKKAKIYIAFLIRSSSKPLSFSLYASAYDFDYNLSKDDALKDMADQLANEISTMILDYPDQWFGWLQKRPGW